MIAKFPIELNPEENLSLNYAIGSGFFSFGLWDKINQSTLDCAKLLLTSTQC